MAGRVVEDIGKHRAGGGAAAKGGEKHGFPLGRGTVGCSPDLEGDPTVTQLLEVVLQPIRCPHRSVKQLLSLRAPRLLRWSC